MSETAALLGIKPKPRNPWLSRRPQNRPRNPIIDGRKKCSQCGEVKDAYAAFSWRTRPGGRKAPRCECLACQYLNLKAYRERKCTK